MPSGAEQITSTCVVPLNIFEILRAEKEGTRFLFGGLGALGEIFVGLCKLREGAFFFKQANDRFKWLGALGFGLVRFGVGLLCRRFIAVLFVNFAELIKKASARTRIRSALKLFAQLSSVVVDKRSARIQLSRIGGRWVRRFALIGGIHARRVP